MKCWIIKKTDKNMVYQDEITRVISLQLTNGCNLDCVYCFEKFKRADQNMTFETATRILQKEFDDLAKSKDKSRLKIVLFGGEPLLRFDLIREIHEWTWQQRFDVDYLFSITTNGTLLDDKMKSWFRANKERTRLVLSMDGTEDMQRHNRGTSNADLPIDFVKEVWPDQHVKSTMSKQTLRDYSKGVISVLERGYNVVSTFAIGEDWSEEDARVYKHELEALGDYYMEHPDLEPMPILTRTYAELLDQYVDELPPKCGTGETMVSYDYDGTPYPCHMFLPIVSGKNNYDEISKIDFTSRERMINEECRECGLLRICRTCFGFNMRDRGDVNRRDKRMCPMILAEAQAVSAFQINYYTMQSKRWPLTGEELLTLKCGLLCYSLCRDFSFLKR